MYRARGGGGHLRGLVLRAQVLDHLVRCEDVAAYLLPPLGEHLISADLGERLHLVRLGLGIGLGLVLGLASPNLTLTLTLILTLTTCCSRWTIRSFALSISRARFLLRSWLRSSWQRTASPEGRCLMRTAVSTWSKLGLGLGLGLGPGLGLVPPRGEEELQSEELRLSGDGT